MTPNKETIEAGCCELCFRGIMHGSDTPFCANSNCQCHQKEVKVCGYPNHSKDYCFANDRSCPIIKPSQTKECCQQLKDEWVKKLEGMKKEEISTQKCENCGEEGYGKAWYGKGRATGDSWGDRYVPTGSVVFCKDCAGDFKIGKDWDGEEIWKTTSDLPQHEEIRLNHIKYKDKEAIGYNQAIEEVIKIIKQ